MTLMKVRKIASIYCWPSVSIKRGASTLLARKVVRVEYDWTFGQLLAVVNCSPDGIVKRVAVLKNETFVDTVHNLLFVHFNQNFCGLYHGMCCIFNE